MTANQSASIELDIAARNIHRFTLGVQDENIRLSTSGSIDAYGLMRKSLAIQLDAYERVDAAKTSKDLAGIRRHISDAKVSYQQASRVLLDATTLAFMSSLVPDSQDPAIHIALNMTAIQKAQLAKVLESRFGPALRKKAEDDSGPVQAAKAPSAKLEKQWKCAK